MTDTGGDLVFSSGRKLTRANGGIVGIDKDCRVFGGYDNYLYPLYDYDAFSDMDEEELAEQWTGDDRRELAEYMIARWQRFRDKQPSAGELP